MLPPQDLRPAAPTGDSGFIPGDGCTGGDVKDRGHANPETDHPRAALGTRDRTLVSVGPAVEASYHPRFLRPGTCQTGRSV